MSFESSRPSGPLSRPPSGRSLFGSLSFRLTTWYAAILLVGLTTLGALSLFSVRRAVVRSEDIVIHERLERHRALLGRVGLSTFEHAISDATELEGEHGPVRVRDGSGRTLYRHGDLENAGTVVSTSVTSDLRLEVASSEDPWARLGPPVKTAVLSVLIGCLLIGIAGGVYLTRRALRPVAALALTARAVIQSGDLSRRVDVAVGGSGELHELALLVNRMLERNQGLVRSTRDALDNVAHDLRTPLTRLRGIAEVALRTDDPNQAPEALADCIEESDRALIMLRTLMDISEAEAGIMKLNLGFTDMRAIALETVDLYEQVADEAGVALSVLPGDAVTTLADAIRVRQAVANLVDNAVKYTPRGGRVEVVVESDIANLEARFCIRDSGCGIPPDALPRIWDRLYRVDPSRAARGLGLGLSLVKAIALAHQGRAAVESVPDHGSSFILVLPLRHPGGADA